MGIGGAWFELEHQAFGIDFGHRLRPAARLAGRGRRRRSATLLDGGEVTSAPGGRYAFDDLRIEPPPVQARLPIMIGGAGERKTLRIVAEHADIWNVFGTPETLAHKDEVLRAHCAEVGRDPAAIERTVGCKITIRRTEAEAERVRRAHARAQPDAARRGWRATPPSGRARPSRSPRRWSATDGSASTRSSSSCRRPYDAETMETLITVVKPMVEAVPMSPA